MVYGDTYSNFRIKSTNWICNKCGQSGHRAWDCWQYNRPPTISEINSQRIGILPNDTVTDIYNQGWQCPECKLFYRPFVKSCDCQQEVAKAHTDTPKTDPLPDEPGEFVPFELEIDLHGITVIDNYTETHYPVTTKTVIDLLKSIHGLE